MLSKSEMGLQIRALRDDRGLSQRELAKLVGMKKATLGYTELGQRYPTLHETVALARYFGVLLNRFVAGDVATKSLRTPLEAMLNIRKDSGND